MGDKDLRKVEVLIAGIGWVDVKFEELLKDDCFRMFESTNEAVMDEAGNTEFLAKSDAYCIDGLWIIDVDLDVKGT